VRVKKANQPPRLIRYLLSADRKLQRISLRKLKAPVKKAKKAPRSTRSGKPQRGPWAVDRLALIVGVVVVIGASALIASRQPPARTPSVPTISAAPAPPVPPVPPEFKPPLASTSQRDPEHAKAEIPRASAKPAASKDPVTKTTGESAMVPTTKVNEPAIESPKAAAMELAPKPAPENDPAVTITGCLELESESFWLKDTSGTGAPTARSWRSAFLKKRPARIELVDATNALPLPTYVGQRVAATGLLVNREMQMRSLYRVAGSCN
jgi:hypothetical protein